MTLLAEIQAKCSAELIASRDHDAIAVVVNVGRTKPTSREIGKGTVLETIGLTAGNAFLDVVDNVADFRHVKQLVADGRLIVSSPLVLATIQSLVPAVLTQGNADALMALAHEPDPVTSRDVMLALFDDSGNWLGD